MSKSKRVMIVIIAIIVIGGTITMVNAYKEKNFVEINREKIEQNVRSYVERYKLDPEKLLIEGIGEPIQLPTGEKSFSVDIQYMGYPYFSLTLRGNPDTLSVNDSKELIIVRIFNELYLEERYDEFKPTIDYLSGIGITDPLRHGATKIKYFQTNVGIDSTINSKIKEVFWESDEKFNRLKQYIKDNKSKISQLDTNIRIIGIKEGIDENQANNMRKHLEKILPKSNYVVELGVDNRNTGEHEGLYTYLTIK